MTQGLVVRAMTVRLGDKTLVDGVGMEAPQGGITGLIGPNGAGKSTLLRAILGLQAAQGQALFNGTDLATLSRRDRAQRAAFVEQSGDGEARLAVRDAVLLGRIPFQSAWQTAPSPQDRAAVETALAALDLAGFADRSYHTLSGGEQQRVQIARALAQQPRLLLLDEPTSHLDLYGQLAMLDLLRRRARAGATVLVALHDLNLAASFCDRLVVLQAGRVAASGVPGAVLTPALLRTVYGVEATIMPHPRDGRPLIACDLPG